MASAFHQRCGFEFGNQSLYKKKKKKKAGEVAYQSPLFSFDPTKLRFLCNRYDLLYICNVHLFVILNFIYVYVLDV